MQAYHNVDSKNSDPIYCNNQAATSGSGNFDSFWCSWLSIFQILTGSNWHEIMLEVTDKEGLAHAIFFMTCYMVINFIMLNLVIGYIIYAQTTAGKLMQQKKEKDDKDDKDVSKKLSKSHNSMKAIVNAEDDDTVRDQEEEDIRNEVGTKYLNKSLSRAASRNHIQHAALVQGAARKFHIQVDRANFKQKRKEKLEK
eukprot:UC4_evm1s397